jgi:hypothetical protein
MASAVEELLRFNGPVQATGRVAKEDIEIGGVTVREGQVAFVLLGSANHDPAKFPNPERLDLTRNPTEHLAFGDGIHFCLGAPLARIEGQVAIGALLRRCRALKLVSDTAEWRESSVLRGLKTLPVTF